MTIDISTTLYYAIPIIIQYWFWFYVVFTDKDLRSYDFDVYDDRWFLAVFLTAIGSIIFFEVMEGTFNIIW